LGIFKGDVNDRLIVSPIDRAAIACGVAPLRPLDVTPPSQVRHASRIAERHSLNWWRKNN
jgi:hypothetical protein